VVDSLAAIEQVVFKENAISLPDLLQALDANFLGHEVLLARLRNPDKTHKYGNEQRDADGIARWVATVLDKLFFDKGELPGRRYRVGYWTMTNHAGFGRLSRATAQRAVRRRELYQRDDPGFRHDTPADPSLELGRQRCRPPCSPTAWRSTSSTP